MSARLRRAARLLDLAQEKVDLARIRLAEARGAVAEARAEIGRCEDAWTQAARASCGELTVVTELERQSSHLRTLRLRAEAAGRRLAEATAVERRCESSLVEVSTQRRKLELWLERMAGAEHEEQRRAESRATDELAARTLRERS